MSIFNNLINFLIQNDDEYIQPIGNAAQKALSTGLVAGSAALGSTAGPAGIGAGAALGSIASPIINNVIDSSMHSLADSIAEQPSISNATPLVTGLELEYPFEEYTIIESEPMEIDFDLFDG